MSNRLAPIILACVLGATGVAHAQELRCTQIFMNPSEKRICASPELMKLDQQMGELGRRVEPHHASLKSDQRRFRKALKTCDGDEACLTTSYENRIAELQATIGTLAPPTSDEIATLDEGAAKAEEKRESQEAARQRFAQQLAEKDAETEVVPAPTESFQAPEPELIAVQEVVAEEAMMEQVSEPIPPDSDGETSWGTLALMGLFALGVLMWIRDWAHKAFRRCPKCKNWSAGTVIDSSSNSYTDYKTKPFEDVHKDKHGMRTGSTSKTRQVAVRVTDTVDYLRCRICNEEWIIGSQSRSS